MPMPPFQGSITALITPFKNGEIDEKAFQRLVEWQIGQGTPWARAGGHHGQIADAHP